MRSQALHAASRQLAAFAEALEASAATKGAAEDAAVQGGSLAAAAEQPPQETEGTESGAAEALPQAGRARRAAAVGIAGADPAAPAESDDGAEDFRASETAVSFAVELLLLVYGVVTQGLRFTQPKSTGPDAWPPEARQLYEELVTALEGSQVLEHAARLVLLLPSLEDLFNLAMEALITAWASLQPPPPPRAAPSAGWRAAAADWWRLAVAVVEDALRFATRPAQHYEMAARLRVFIAGGVFDAGRLPPEPPPVVAAALDGGLLRCLELLLRRAGRAPQGPEAAVMRKFIAKAAKFEYLWPLLAYGEPRQAAALVATLRKLLQLVDPRVVMVGPWDPLQNDQQCFAHTVFKVLDDALRTQDTVFASTPGGSPSPATQQLLRLLSLAACQWLPELARLAHRGAFYRRGAVSRNPAGVTLLLLMTEWVQLLAARALAQPTSSGKARSGEEAATAAAAADGGSDGGWREPLLGEVGAAQLLGAALELTEQAEGAEAAEEDLVFLWRLVAACTAVAAAAVGPCDRSEQRELAAPAEAPADLEQAGNPSPPAPAASTGAWTTPGCGGSTACPVSSLPLPWRPELLRAAAARLRSASEDESAADAEKLAAWLERGCVGPPGLQPPPQPGPLASALLPPAEARRLLRTCANPACVNLEGDSEADLQLLSCGGCGEVGYCCRPCQTAQWRAGHKEACAGGGAQRGGGGISMAGC
ncbi:hypothetical protein GPECTOR_433g309 [Gonium pectorale]|uniref:phytol kinase n=1 Tax=Gonium pectorale TaxID=33097 RepID=A0A150FV42_GONPE|nr:hypothetical protein GPECTOR_433g309 [Gonium pectorale]|eukprot:KXZ41491.1 hypothetical protein GPECTOR_433g309 [Gonium pectorale]